MAAIDYSWLILLEQINGDALPADRDNWKELGHFKESIRQGDELWRFECSAGNHQLAGCSGIALKRGGSIVAHLVTRRILS